jgi:8-oxo-dGTP diphosphatase
VVNGKSILMGKRNDNGLWTQPGGHLNKGETPENGAKRELFEETGIMAKRLKFLGKDTVKNEDGEKLTIYAFLYSWKGEETDTEQDPDEEVQDWKWVSKPKIKRLAAEKLLHVPFEKNVTFRLVGKSKVTSFLKKSDAINPIEKDDDWYSKTAKLIHHESDRYGYGKRHELNANDVEDFYKEAMRRREYDDARYAIFHPTFKIELVNSLIENPELFPYKEEDHLPPPVGMQRPKEKRMAPSSPNQELSYLFHEAMNFLPLKDDQVSNLIQLTKDHISHETTHKIITGLSKNKRISSTAALEMHDALPSEWSRHSTRNQARARLREKVLLDPTVDSETVERLAAQRDADNKTKRMAVEHPNATPNLIKEMQKSSSPHIKASADAAATFHNLPTTHGKNQHVMVSFNSNKARQIRDWVEAHGGSLHHKELSAAGLNLDSMGLSRLKDGKGNVTTKAMQDYIDSIPQSEYLWSTSTYGIDADKFPEDYDDEDPENAPDTEYDDTAHPQHELYKELLGGDKNAVHEIDYFAGGEQRHSSDESKVFRLNLTPDHVKKLKDAGVWHTFAAMNQSSVKSNHPVHTGTGIGWVRYTEGKDGHVFIDEIQSDVGKSLVKTVQSRMQNMVNEGRSTQQEMDQAVARAQALYPDEHHKKIKEIAFGGKDPSEVLHESFHQWMRDKGKVGSQIHIWTPESKARISLSNSEEEGIPAHMYKTYGQNPEKMGYTPAKYGEIKTQKTSDFNGDGGRRNAAETKKTVLRKSRQQFIKYLEETGMIIFHDKEHLENTD